MVKWAKAASEDKDGLLKHIHIIIGEIQIPTDLTISKLNETDFYSKSNVDLGKGLYGDLLSLGIVAKNEYEVSEAGVIVKK